MRILIVSLAVLAALITGVYFRVVAPQNVHQRGLKRIQDVIRRSDQSIPSGQTAQTWHNYVVAADDCVTNYFLRREYYPTAKLEVLAAQFEAKWPNGPKTTRDLEVMVDLLVAAKPDLADATLVLNFRQMLKEDETAAPSTPGKK